MLIVASLFLLVVYSIIDFISFSYMRFYALGILISVQYFRVVVNERRVIWIQPFLIKLLFAAGNIILFIFMMDSFAILVGQFEDYNYNGIGVLTDDILPGLSTAQYSLLRSTTFFIGISSMMLIILFEFRLVYSAFKYRNIPGLNK